MAGPSQQAKILRIGVIQGGRITEEKLIRHGQTVTIGDGSKNTFVLHSSGLPTRFPLFIFRSQQYILAFTDEMDGKLSMDGGVVMGLDGVRTRSSREKDGVCHFPLTEQIRGKITVAGTTILFQFVPPPTVAPRSARSEFSAALIKQIDLTYWGILAISSVMHAVVMLYAMSLPAPKGPTIDDIPDTFARIIIPAARPVPVEPAVADEAKKKEEEEARRKAEEEARKKEEEEAKKKEKQPESTPPPKDEAQIKAERVAAIKGQGILRLLGSKFAKNGPGSVSDIISSNTDTPGLENLMNVNATGMRVAKAGEVSGLRGDPNDTRLAGVGEVGSTGRDLEVKTQTKKSLVPKLDLTNPSEIEGNMDRGSLDSVIKKNLPGVTACYEQALKANPNLRGKIYIDFTVEQTGRVSVVNVRGSGHVDQGMEDCIKGRVIRWRFPQSEEGGADISLPIVLTASQS